MVLNIGLALSVAIGVVIGWTVMALLLVLGRVVTKRLWGGQDD